MVRLLWSKNELAEIVQNRIIFRTHKPKFNNKCSKFCARPQLDWTWASNPARVGRHGPPGTLKHIKSSIFRVSFSLFLFSCPHRRHRRHLPAPQALEICPPATLGRGDMPIDRPILPGLESGLSSAPSRGGTRAPVANEIASRQ